MKKGLGKGLDVLFASDFSTEAESVSSEGGETSSIKITDIDPNKNQPRKLFYEDSLSELAESIKVHGILQPLALRRKAGGRYEIIAGERRFRAAKRAGLTSVPAIIVDADDRKVSELALIENLQRENLNPVEEAEGIKALIEEYGLTQEEAAERLSKSRSTLANAMRLLSLSEGARALLREGKIERGHAKVILALPEERQEAAAVYVAERGLNVRQTEELVRRMMASKEEKKKENEVKVDYIASLERDLTKSLGRKVRLVHGKKKGRIELEYYGNEDLELLISALGRLKK